MNYTHNTDLPPTSAIPPKLTERPLKNMVRARSTGRHSRASKNLCGLKNEIECSKSFHREGCPLLVSPDILRKRFLGQIDLARLKKDREGWVLEIGEVKSSEIGEEMMLRGQRARLFHAQKFLSGLFGHRSKLVCLTSANTSGT